jgi:hypothetical protein
MQNFHSFNIKLAKKYGIKEALLLAYIYHCYELNKANNQNFFNGTYWLYSTYETFTNTFIYLSSEQIRTVLEKLENKDLIKTGSFNKTPFDKTKWYTVTKKGISELQNTFNKKEE